MTDVKKLFVKTYGCQMNVYDSERMAEALGADGYVTTDVVEDADMVLLNTMALSRGSPRKRALIKNRALNILPERKISETPGPSVPISSWRHASAISFS